MNFTKQNVLPGCDITDQIITGSQKSIKLGTGLDELKLSNEEQGNINMILTLLEKMSHTRSNKSFFFPNLNSYKS